MIPIEHRLLPCVRFWYVVEWWVGPSNKGGGETRWIFRWSVVAQNVGRFWRLTNGYDTRFSSRHGPRATFRTRVTFSPRGNVTKRRTERKRVLIKQFTNGQHANVAAGTSSGSNVHESANAFGNDLHFVQQRRYTILPIVDCGGQAAYAGRVDDIRRGRFGFRRPNPLESNTRFDGNDRRTIGDAQNRRRFLYSRTDDHASNSNVTKPT